MRDLVDLCRIKPRLVKKRAQNQVYAGVPGADGPAREIGQSRDAGSTLGDEDDVDLLEHRADGDDGKADVACREQAFDASGLREVVRSLRNELLRIDAEPAGLDIDLESLPPRKNPSLPPGNSRRTAPDAAISTGAILFPLQAACEQHR